MKKENSRRQFIKAGMIGLTAMSVPAFSFVNTKTFESKINQSANALFFKISLAQWSLHRSFFDKKLNADEFPAIAIEQYGISAVEYVNGFYMEKSMDEIYWQDLQKRAKNAGVQNLLLMVDDEGDLGDTNDAARKKAVENHYKWMDAAKLLDCHSIRVNGFGEGSRQDVAAALIDGLGELADYASRVGINVLVENHGLFSSDGKWVADVISQVDRTNCGTLPDFGNFCTAEKWGSTEDGSCPEVYDRYMGVEEMMPFAKGVSAKSYRFNEEGMETTIDYGRMLKIVKAADFTGHIGIEFEGNELSEPEGIRATKNLLILEGTKL